MRHFEEILLIHLKRIGYTHIKRECGELYVFNKEETIPIDIFNKDLLFIKNNEIYLIDDLIYSQSQNKVYK